MAVSANTRIQTRGPESPPFLYFSPPEGLSFAFSRQALSLAPHLRSLRSVLNLATLTKMTLTLLRISPPPPSSHALALLHFPP
jgi:hypothetical protein